MNLVNKNDLKINQTLFDFINNEVLPGTKVNQDSFWIKFSKVVHELSPINKKLIEKREKIQKQIDEWHLTNSKEEFSSISFVGFKTNSLFI